MIEGQKIIAFTPCGRKRYMDLLAGYVLREHERGHIDEWILFNNAYFTDDATYADQLAAHWPWVKIFRGVKEGGGNWQARNYAASESDFIYKFYTQMTEGDGVIYIRIDDAIVFIEENTIPTLIRYRLDNPEPFLVFPIIINNLRTLERMQASGIIPTQWEGAKYNWHREDFLFRLHLKTLEAIRKGEVLSKFDLPSARFTNFDAGWLSINAFAIFGKDMLACDVPEPEERYLALTRPQELNRQNARVGNTAVVHFAYHGQMEIMDKSGLLAEYAKYAPPLGFETVGSFVPPPMDDVHKSMYHNILSAWSKNK